MSDIVENTLQHYGILGMKWGVRRFQNPDGSLTPEGRRRYGYDKKGNKTPHRVRLEAKYRAKGYSNEDAERLATRQIKGERFALGVLGGAAVGAAAYAAYQHIGKKYFDVTLEKGTELHYINALGDKANFDRRLYTSFERRDTQKYRGMLAKFLQKNAPNTTIYDTVLKATEQIKAPSQKQAHKLYQEFLGKKVSFREYLKYNQGLVYSRPDDKKFFDFLKSKGYNAILDANDQFLSGYGSKKPLILFNAASSTVKAGQSIVSDKLINRLNNIQLAQILSKELAPSVGLGVAYCAWAKSHDTKKRYDTVNKYFLKNPNTKLSYADVYNAVETYQKGTTIGYRINENKLKKAGA